jgi:type IV pilus assembly protein PilO
MLKKLQSLAWYIQLAMFGGIALLIFGLFWNFVTSGMRSEIKDIDEQVASLKQQNEAARIASQRINEFRADYQRKQEEYDELKALLPEQREITNVLQNLQDRARATNLSLRRFSPKDDFQKDFCSGKPVEVEVSSTFANLRSFYEELAKMQRIVSITDFNIKQTPDQNPNKTIDAQFLLTAYYVSPEKLQNNKPAAPQQSGAPQQSQGTPQQQVQQTVNNATAK